MEGPRFAWRLPRLLSNRKKKLEGRGRREEAELPGLADTAAETAAGVKASRTEFWDS